MGLEKNESYTFAQLLQFVIFTQANDVKDALSNILFDSVEQAQLILSKRAENYKLTLKAPNQLKNLFLLVKHIYSYPAELKKLFFIKTLFLKIKYINRLRLCLLIQYSPRFYISHIPLDRFISLIPNRTRALDFFSFLDDIHRLEHLVPYYHFFQEKYVEAKNVLLKQALSIFWEIPISVKCTLKSVSLEDKQMLYSSMDITIHFKNTAIFR